MNWLSRLKELEAAPAAMPTEPTKAPFVAFVGPVPPSFQIIERCAERLGSRLLTPTNGEGAAAFAPMSTVESELISKWLQFIGEADSTVIVSVLIECERDAKVRSWFIGQIPYFGLSASLDAQAARQALFINRGLCVDEAKDMTDLLALRDNRRDERHACIECIHLSGTRTERRCGNWHAVGLQGSAIPAENSSTLRRCRGYEAGIESRILGSPGGAIM